MRRYTIPASDTPEGKARIAAYYEALGQFVHTFSQVETAVARTLWTYAGTRPPVAKIIFAGTRVDGGCGYIKQLAAATTASKELKDDLEDVLQQLGIINGARNNILHYGAQSVAEGNAIVSDEFRAKGEPTVFPISPELLKAMTVDLRQIMTHLNYRHLGRRPPKSEYGRKVLDDILRSPWQYKHPGQTKSQTKREQSRPDHRRGSKQPRQRRSSPE